MCDKKNSVLFIDTECVVLSFDFKLLDENHVLLRVPRKDNMYSVDLKNIVPSGGLTCLFAKATLDESNLWHKSLGHINFKTMNKLVRGNLVRGIENLIDLKVKVIRCDNRTEFKNKVMNQFYEINGRKPALSFMRLFGCPVTILNTLDHLDALTISMNYKPVVAGNQTNGNASTKENIDAGQDGKKIVHDQEYILLPLLTYDPSLSKSSKDSPDAGFKPSGEEEKMDFEHPENEDSEVPNTEEPRVNQEQDANVNITNNINTVCPTINDADIKINVVDENIVYGCIDDPNMPNLEEIVYSNDDEEVSAEADMNNLATTMPAGPILTTKVHKDHPLKQIIGDIHSAPQNRRITKNVTEHVEPKKKVWTLVDLPYGKRAIGTKWVYRNKKDNRGIVVRNKARLVAQGYTQEEGIDYDEFFALVARIEAIRLFLAYASFMNFIVYQMDAKSAFLYDTIKEEVYVCQPPGFEDPEFPNKVYKVEKALYGLHQALRAWYETLSTYLLENRFRIGTIDKTLFIKKDKDDIMLMQVYVDNIFFGSTKRFQVTPKTSHLYDVKKIFRYLKDHPKLGLWYPRDSPFDLEAFSDSDYAGASLDRKSTIRGCQFLGRRLISWQCKKHTIVSNSTTKAEYVAAANCYGQIHTDHNVADLLTKAFDVSRFQYLIARYLEWNGTTAKDEFQVSVVRVTYYWQVYLMLLVAFNTVVKIKNVEPIKQKWVKDETVIKEWEDRMERAATTASSLEAEQDSGNINRTQSMATLNKGSGPKCQDTILEAQKLKFDLRLHLHKSYDPHLSRVNTLGSGEDSMKLKKLMEFCTKLSIRVVI
ncbi:putative ribonuclease H-like domain-containing protein [Tanacetum coccineum]